MQPDGERRRRMRRSVDRSGRALLEFTESMEPGDSTATVLAVEEHPLPYYTLVLRSAAALGSTRPGQFVMVQVGDRLEPYLRRPFSVRLPLFYSDSGTSSS